MEPSELSPGDQLMRSTRQSLAANLGAALVVAAKNENYEEHGKGSTQSPFKKLKLTETKARTAISRSTLTKLVNEKVGKANPDLDTLCRLAAMLNVPPAFLLMTKDDWTRLFRAIEGLQEATAGGYLKAQLEQVKQAEKVLIGLNLAKKMGHYPIPTPHLSQDEAGDMRVDIQTDIARRNDRMFHAVVNMTAMLQNSISENKRDYPMATALSALFGSSIK
jgi:transcriptional regulator with XRE-family HTH domain